MTLAPISNRTFPLFLAAQLFLQNIAGSICSPPPALQYIVLSLMIFFCSRAWHPLSSLGSSIYIVLKRLYTPPFTLMYGMIKYLLLSRSNRAWMLALKALLL